MFIIHRTFETIKNHAKVVLRLMAVTCNNVGDKTTVAAVKPTFTTHYPKNIYIWLEIS